jgi:hypothetical protein
MVADPVPASCGDIRGVEGQSDGVRPGEAARALGADNPTANRRGKGLRHARPTYDLRPINLILRKFREATGELTRI